MEADDRRVARQVEAAAAAIARYRAAMKLAGDAFEIQSAHDAEARERAQGSLDFAIADLHEYARCIEMAVALRLGREPADVFDFQTGAIFDPAVQAELDRQAEAPRRTP